MSEHLIKMEKRINRRGQRDGLVSKKFILFFSVCSVVKKYILIPDCPG